MASPELIKSIIATTGCATVFIDDSGSPGQKQNIPHLPDDRFSWSGVVVPPLMGLHVYEQLNNCLQLIEEEYGAKELHFAEILAGRGTWKGIPFDSRLAVFQSFAYIFSEEGFVIFNQTLWEGNVALEKISKEFPTFADKDLSIRNCVPWCCCYCGSGCI